MYDLKSWFIMPSTKDGKLWNGKPYGRETNHLEGVSLTGSKTAAYHYDNGKQIWITKSQKRYPWDVKPYDLQNIYDLVTELDWSNSANYKKNHDPMPICPRFWDGDESWFGFVRSPISESYSHCALTHSGPFGPTFFKLHQPCFIDHQGDLGQLATIRLSYYWSDGQHREELLLTQEFGWVTWTHALKTVFSPGFTEYLVDTKTIHNKLMPGSLIPLFDCTNAGVSP